MHDSQYTYIETALPAGLLLRLALALDLAQDLGRTLVRIDAFDHFWYHIGGQHVGGLSRLSRDLDRSVRGQKVRGVNVDEDDAGQTLMAPVRSAEGVSQVRHAPLVSEADRPRGSSVKGTCA